MINVTEKTNRTREHSIQGQSEWHLRTKESVYLSSPTDDQIEPEPPGEEVWHLKHWTASKVPYLPIFKF